VQGLQVLLLLEQSRHLVFQVEAFRRQVFHHFLSAQRRVDLG
jgi:hypothetical protein